MSYNASMVTRDAGYVHAPTTWPNSNYVPLLYAKKVLQKFYAQTVFKEVTNTEYESEFKNMGV